MSRVAEIQKQIEELEKKTQELQKELEFEKNKYVIDYPFEVPDSYWRLELNGVITKDWWSNDDWERHCYKQGNIFLTEEEAQREIERRILLTRFKQFRDKCNGDWKPDFKDVLQDKYSIQFNYNCGTFTIFNSGHIDGFRLLGYFKERAAAELAIELFGDEIKCLYMEE